MYIKDRAGEAKSYLIEERNVHSEVVLNGSLMVESHSDNQIRFLDQLLSQNSLNMLGWIGTILRQSILHDWMDRLRLRDDAG